MSPQPLLNIESLTKTFSKSKIHGVTFTYLINICKTLKGLEEKNYFNLGSPHAMNCRMQGIIVNYLMHRTMKDLAHTHM